MPKVKVPRKSTAMDMTAMCDVAFLLLTFFMLTTKFRPPELAPVDLPSSRSDIKIPDKNVLLITCTKDGKVFFGLDNQKIRERALERMETSFQSVKFTPEQKVGFSLMDEFGVPFEQLPSVCAMSNEERVNAGQKGVPIDSSESKFNRNELGEWIYNSRMAEAELRAAGKLGTPEKDKDGNELKGLFICLKGAGSADYSTVKKIITTFTERNVNKFNIITTLEAGGVAVNDTKKH